MNICFKKIENLYLKIFIFKPKIISLILFIPFLYLIGWIYCLIPKLATKTTMPIF